MANVDVSVSPYSRRIAFANANFISLQLPAWFRQIDIVFEDSSGKASLGNLKFGEHGGNAPTADDARVFGWSFFSESKKRNPLVISIAHPGGAGHYASIVAV